MFSHLHWPEIIPDTLSGQIELLQQKGLQVSNPERAIRYLMFEGLFRLSGYFPPFLLSSGNFQNTTFDEVQRLYSFDQQLRLLVMDAVEKIEVAVRTTISNTLNEQYGPYWYKNEKLFVENYEHHHLIELIRKSSESTDPPSWIVAERMSIGFWSRIFSALKSREDQKKISKIYNIPYKIMISWLHSFTSLRNLCAHHERLWNRTFTIKPKVPEKYKNNFSDSSKFCAQAAVLNIFLSVIAEDSIWQKRLHDLVMDNKNIPINAMGFPVGWENDPFWRIRR